MIPFAILSIRNKIPLIGGIKKIATVGLGHLFLTDDGKLYAYGKNTNGRFGSGNANDLTTMTLIKTGVADIYYNTRTTILFMNDGSVLACGSMLAYGLTPNVSYTYLDVTSIFSSIAGFTSFSISMEDSFSFCICAVMPDGRLMSMGYNNRGQFGRGNTTNSLGVFVQTSTDVKKVIHIQIGTTVILKTDSTVLFSGYYILTSGTNDIISFTTANISCTDIMSDGYNGGLFLITTGGLFFRGGSGGYYGISSTATLGVNNRITLPFLYNTSTFKLYVSNSYGVQSAWISNGVQSYASGPNTANFGRLGVGQTSVNPPSTWTAMPTNIDPTWNIRYVVSANQYSAFVTDTGNVYATGAFGGYQAPPGGTSYTGAQLVNYPGQLPTVLSLQPIQIPL